MTERNLFIIGGVGVFLALAVGYWFTAHFWTSMRVKAEAKRLIIASLPDRASVEFQGVKASLTGRICGEISVTNGRGGFTGFEPFIWEKYGGVELKPKVVSGDEMEVSRKSDLEFWEAKYTDCMANGV